MRASLLLALAFALPALSQPAIPEDAEDGDIVEIDGKLFEVWDGELTPIEVKKQTDEKKDEAKVDDKLPVLSSTVTGSRVQNGDNSAVRTDVVDAATIEESGSRTLSDALQRVGGLQISSPVGTGENVSIDGLDGKYVKILIDGRPVNGTVNSRVDVSRLPISLADVEKIEIVRGPMSALYGSDAMGGVVNIVTRRASAKTSGDVELSTRLDGRGIQRTAFSMRGTGGNDFLALKLTASALFDGGRDRATRLDDDSIVFRPDGVLDLPHKRQLLFTAEASLYPTDAWALRVYGTASSSEVESRFGSRIPFRDHTDDNQFQLGVVAEGDLAPLHTLKIDTRIDRYLHRFEKLPDAGQASTPPFCRHALGGTFLDVPCPAEANVRTKANQDQSRTELVYTGVLAQKQPWVEELKLAVGAVYRHDEIARKNGDDEDTLPGAGQQSLFASYAELAYSPIPSLSLVPGARLEATVPGAGDEAVSWALSPRLSLRQQLPLFFAFRASYGNAFRVPDFLERYLRFDHSELGYIVEGNPDLLPESNNGLRGELVFEPGPVRVGVETFLNLTENLIDAIPTGRFGGDGAGGEVPVFSYLNRSRAYTAGVNLRANVDDLAGFSFDLTYQYLINAVDASRCPDDNPWFCSAAEGALSLPNRPIHSGHLGARYKIRATDTTLFSQFDFQDERFVLDPTLQTEAKLVAGFANLRVGVRQPVFEKAEVLLVLENLLDNYDPIFGPKPGRAALVTLRSGF